MTKLELLSFLPFIFLGFTTAYSQTNKKNTRQEYIFMYKDLAVKEMKRTGIPASITLAQGVLESGNGNSRLARKANNHFGIKCHDWKGKKIRHDDDLKNECFRKYKSANKSYEDHSDFLTSKKRYSFLFALEPTDYKKWAEGLKEAGYATSKNYDKTLIKIIEEEQLYAYDQGIDILKTKDSLLASLNNSQNKIQVIRTLEMNRIKYIIAKPGDSYSSISDEFDLLPWELKKYNDLSEVSKIDSGQIFYIQPKRNKAEAGKKTHSVKEGETMHYISQLYGIKLNVLYEKNLLEVGTQPETGQVLQLRKALKDDKKPFDLTIKEDVQVEKNGETEFEFEFED